MISAFKNEYGAFRIQDGKVLSNRFLDEDSMKETQFSISADPKMVNIIIFGKERTKNPKIDAILDRNIKFNMTFEPQKIEKIKVKY